MADGIIDNAPEMDLGNPAEFEKLVANAKAEAPTGAKEPVAPKPDVKPEKPDASSASEPAKEGVDETPVDESNEDEGEPDSPATLKARVRGLQAELARRKGNAEKVNELEVQLARVQGQLEQINRAPRGDSPTLEEAIKKLDDRALIGKQTDWDDELADARARYAQAEERGDDKALERQGQRIAYAKKVLSAIRLENLERTDQKNLSANQQRDEQTKVKTELDSMYSSLTTEFPDFQDKDSELWKAGNDEFLAHPEIMKRLGASGEIVAAALAILKNPELIRQKSEVTARQEVVGKLEQGVKRALKSGASSPTTGRTVIPQVTSGEGLARFNEMVDRIKGG